MTDRECKREEDRMREACKNELAKQLARLSVKDRIDVVRMARLVKWGEVND